MIIPRRPRALDGRRPSAERVWYATFGSNMHLERLTYYLVGAGPPTGRGRIRAAGTVDNPSAPVR